MKAFVKGNERSEVSALGWLFLACVVTHVAGALAFGLLSDKGITVPVEVELVISEFTILIPSTIFILLGDYSFRNDLGFRRIRPGSFFMCILLSALVTPVASFVNVLSQLFVPNTMVQMSDTLLESSDAALVFLGALYGPFCEELLFRGILFNRYGRYTGPLRAGLISALYFALVHMNINQAAYAFVLGVIFSVVNTAAGSMYPSLIIHVCINGMNLLLLIISGRASESLGDDMISAAESARTGDVIYFLIGITLVAALICILIAIPCIAWMAKHEGRSEELYDMIKKKRPKVRWLTIPAALAVIMILFIMFGLPGVLSYIGKGA